MVYGYKLEKGLDDKVRRKNSKAFFKVLGDEKRVEVLRLISRRKWYSNELAKHFKLTPATMSYHISKLIGLGLVDFESGEQNRLFYRINKKRLKEMFDDALKDILGE